MAEAAHHSGNFEEGAGYYEDVLALDPYHTRSLASFAMLMRMLGRLEEAESLYLQVCPLPTGRILGAGGGGCGRGCCCGCNARGVHACRVSHAEVQ